MAPFDTTSRAMGVRTEPRLAPRSGNLTPPRFSPSCSHCLIPEMPKRRGLWLSRGTIVCGQGHCKAACQGCFWPGWTRSSPFLPSFMKHTTSQVVFAHPTSSLFHISGLSAEVIQSPDIWFSRCSEWSSERIEGLRQIQTACRGTFRTDCQYIRISRRLQN